MKSILQRGLSALTLVMLLLLGSSPLKAQFTISESLKNSTANSGIIFGGSPSAYLTSGKDDPQGQGWLRITKATQNQKGYAYIDKSFPSTLGVFIDFEYKAWRSSSDGSYNGADGFSIFLFNADSTFRLGGYGGSLGYAPISGVTNLGLAGGYIGVGLDEYGNFSNPTEGRNGGPGLKPNAIVLRGPTTNNANTTNAYLAGYQLNANSNSNAGIDYNGTVVNGTRVYPQTRPDDNTYYRRVQISVVPDNGKYDITVKMATTPGGAFTTYINYSTTTVPPANLKLGFAASTGGGFNYHELRNLYITTPGGVRVDKTVDQSSASIGAQLKYTMNVYNSTTAAISGLLLKDTLYDGNGSIIPSDVVRIDSIRFKNNGNTGNVVTTQPSNTNPFSATLKMGASTSSAGDAIGTFLVYATVLKRPAGGNVSNRVYVDPTNTGISDADLTNNAAGAQTQIIETDLSVTATHTDVFYAGDQKKNLIVNVINNGPDATGNTTTLNDTLPAGFTYTGATGNQGNGWNITFSGNVVTAVYNGSVADGSSFPQLNIPVNVDATLSDGMQLVNKAGIANSADNTLSNNIASDTIVVHALNPGKIGDDQSISSGSVPAPFAETQAPTGSADGTYTYQWQISTDGINFANIDGATAATYTETGMLSSITYYRRLVNAPGRGQAPLPTNIITVNINSAMPVILSDFSGSRINDANVLSWITSSEINNKGFELLRSTDGGQIWKDVTFKTGHGTSTVSNSYSYSDREGAAYPVALYRLIQYDLDGKSNPVGNIVSVQGNGSMAVSLYPNPATTNINIRLVSVQQGAAGMLRIISSEGAVVKVLNIAAGQNSVSVSLAGLASGNYFVQLINSKNAVIYKGQFIKR